MHIRAALLICLAGLFGSGASLAVAQNLVPNPGFDTGLSSWSTSGTVAHDDTRDAGGLQPASGSARVDHVLLANVNSNTGVFQCVTNLQPGTTYAFGGSGLMQQLPDGGRVRVTLIWFGNNTCSPPSVASSPGTLLTSIGPSWQSSTGIAVAPPGATSAFIQTTNLSGDGGTIVANYDDFFLQEEEAAPEPVPTMGVAWLLLLASGLTGLASRKRGVA